MGTGQLDITCIVSIHYTVPLRCWENGVSSWQSLELQEQCQLAAVLVATGILDLRAIGPQDLPALGILDLRAIGPRDLPALGILDLRAIHALVLPALGILDPRAIGPQDLPALGILDPRAIGPQDLQATTLALEVVIIADLLATT